MSRFSGSRLGSRLSGNTLVSINQRRYSTPGQVIAWMGDRLWTGKPPWHRPGTQVYSA